jgi:hypothetical protein
VIEFIIKGIAEEEGKLSGQATHFKKSSICGNLTILTAHFLADKLLNRFARFREIFHKKKYREIWPRLNVKYKHLGIKNFKLI